MEAGTIAAATVTKRAPETIIIIIIIIIIKAVSVKYDITVSKAIPVTGRGGL
jgi:hypothetical protein